MLKNNVLRVVSMIKCLDNPQFLLYRLFHYAKKYVPFKTANNIACKNILSYGQNIKNEIVFDTYDGSCQSVHPDVLFDDTNYWVALTPYPYGMEEYENPCVYRIHDLRGRISLDNMMGGGRPIALPRAHNYGFHLSDPCIFHYGNSVNIVFRESWKSSNTIYNGCFLARCLEDDSWSKPFQLCQSETDPLLSPAILIDPLDTIHMYSAVNDESLFHRVFDKKYNLLKTERVGCIGIPEFYTVWHISIVHSNNLDKSWSGEDSLKGLFLLKCEDSKSFKLFLASSNGYYEDWVIENEIRIPDFIAKNAKIVYKSCFVPGSTDILLSFRDQKDRYRLCII